MREIKFRAWDRWLRQMVFDFTVEHYTSDGESFELIAPRTAPNGEFETMPLMQFTGIRDKNGVEIYEGDIMRIDDPDGEFVDVGIGLVQVAEFPFAQLRPVEFREASFGCEIKPSRNHTGGFYSLQEIKENCSDLEVIGNIYENPELLENKK